MNAIAQALGGILVMGWVALVHVVWRRFNPQVSTTRTFGVALLGPLAAAGLALLLISLFLPWKDHDCISTGNAIKCTEVTRPPRVLSWVGM